MGLRQLRKTLGKTAYKRCVRAWQGQCQHRPRRRGAHRGQVRQIHRQCFPAEIHGSGTGQKMHALDHRVDRHHQLLPGWRAQHCPVVADTDAHVVARHERACANHFNQIKFHGNSLMR